MVKGGQFTKKFKDDRFMILKWQISLWCDSTYEAATLIIRAL